MRIVKTQTTSPELQDMMLDTDALQRLLWEIGNAAQVRSLVYKGSGTAAVWSPSDQEVADAAAALIGGWVVGVQFRYEASGRDCLDTLIPCASGVRLVRIEYPMVARGRQAQPRAARQPRSLSAPRGSRRRDSRAA